MKTRWLAAVVILGLLMPAGRVSSTPLPKRFLLPSGVIEYQIEGQENGKAVMYFDRWGMREAKYTRCVVPVYGQQDILTILDGERFHAIDLVKRVGKKTSVSCMKDYLKAVLTEEISFEEYVLRKLDARKIGQEDILGKPCDIWEIPEAQTRIWYWQWVPLKFQVQRQGSQLVAWATRIQESVAIPENVLSVPKDVRFIDEDIRDILISSLPPQPEGLERWLIPPLTGLSFLGFRPRRSPA